MLNKLNDIPASQVDISFFEFDKQKVRMGSVASRIIKYNKLQAETEEIYKC